MLEPALRSATDPLGADLLARLQAPVGPHSAKATRPYPISIALRIYRRKALEGDRPGIHTDGYPALLAALSSHPGGDVVVHGVRFAEVVFLVFTDAERQRCLGVLRKRLSGSTPGS